MKGKLNQANWEDRLRLRRALLASAEAEWRRCQDEGLEKAAKEWGRLVAKRRRDVERYIAARSEGADRRADLLAKIARTRALLEKAQARLEEYERQLAELGDAPP